MSAKSKSPAVIPVAELRIEFFLTNPLRPAGVHVVVRGETVAILPISEVKRVMSVIEKTPL